MNKQVIASQHNRRTFIKYSSLAIGTTVLTGPYLLRGQNLNSKINIGVIGAGGKGKSDTDNCASENIVALCDVDKNTLDARTTSNPKPNEKSYPSAKTFQDYRKLLEEVKNIDAVTVSTPDHHHACAAIMAMKLGKHVYCQKPLTYSVYEARMMVQQAKEHKVVTQMGNQGSSENGLRRAVEVIQAGVIGPIRQIHVWSNRPVWPQGIDRPAGSDPVPATLDWDVWLGPAPMRPFKDKVYHTFNWRGWQDFGTGALGDMACHTANMPFRAAKLGYPTEIDAESSGINKETYPLSSKIRFQFPEREGLPPVQFWWYDGNPGDPKSFRPHGDLTKEVVDMEGKLPGSGCLLVGDKGKVYSPDDYGARFFIKLNDDKEYISGTKHEAATNVAQTIPRNPSPGDTDHRQHIEWIEAIKAGKPENCYSRFAIAGYLTEIILLGCVALRAGQKLEWDGPGMKATNTKAAAQYVRREYREGWKL